MSGGIEGGTRDQTKVALIFAAFVILLAAGAVLLVKHNGGSGTKAASPAAKLQAYLQANATPAVASLSVVSCKDIGAQTIPDGSGPPISYGKVYACPVTVAMKDGTGGCVGILYAPTSDGSANVVAPPEAIDPGLCRG